MGDGGRKGQPAEWLPKIGADRIIHSEDFPYVIRDDVTNPPELAQLSVDQRNAIVHGNADGLLRI